MYVHSAEQENIILIVNNLPRVVPGKELPIDITGI